MLWNGSEEDRNISSSARKMKTLTVKMETVTLIVKADNLKCVVY
jgi:hypothetical protein